MMKDGSRRWLPPILIECVKPLFRRGIYYSGVYSDFASASSNSSGYDAQSILAKVKAATLEVLAGRAVYERDSVLFTQPEPPLPLLAGLLRAGVENDARLSVLDFGGSLGTSYFQCRDFLSAVNALSWSIVEQAHFVDAGRDVIDSDELRFFFTIDEVVAAARPNVILLASVLQYLPDPDAVLEQLMDTAIDYMIIDRTPISAAAEDLITIQHVPASIYRASYPCRVFSRSALIAKLSSRYRCIAEFSNDDHGASVAGVRFEFGGMILTRI